MEYSACSEDSGGEDLPDQHDKHRDCDDMLSRRLGNLPAPLRKKKVEEHKKFITPSGDPVAYMKQHMRSKSTSDLGEKREDQEKINSRYKELQHLKELLKEEEETWSSKLQDWKSRRRSATLDVRLRKQDREVAEQSMSMAQQRRPKTYREIVEDKKRRESGLFDDGDADFYPHQQQHDDAPAENTKKSYRGAASVPNVRAAHAEKLSARSVEAASADAGEQSRGKSPSPPPLPVKYTSKVTTVINNNSDSSGRKEAAVSPRSLLSTPRSYSPSAPSPRAPITEPVVLAPVVASVTSTAPSTPAPIAESLSPTANNQPYAARASVTMRRKPGSNMPKERPKSAYSFLETSERAATLPRNYHNYSAPKPFVPASTGAAEGGSKFSQYRKSAFANKRNMWEKMGHGESTPDVSATAAPKPLSALLQQDTERLSQSGSADAQLSPPAKQEPVAPPPPAPLSSSPERPASKSDDLPQQVNKQQAMEEPAAATEKNSPDRNSNPQVRPWSKPDATSAKTYRPVSGPALRPWSKTSTLPAAAVSPRQTNSTPRAPIKVTPIDSAPISAPPTPSANTDFNSSAVTKSTSLPNASVASLAPQTKKTPSPRSVAASEPLFDDMKICINQKPRSAKGFGFTVRGGDDGKPVIVNTVSPGGAADVCQLCVGDEILAINDVRLSSMLTQDEIVQLIVDSIITGNLALDIRRYGRAKKTNPMRLTGTKVVMTSGGFVQVRSDRAGKNPVVSTSSLNGNAFADDKIAHSSEASLASTNDDVLPSPRDLPPPPDHLLSPDPLPAKQSAVSRLSPKQPFPKRSPSPTYRAPSPLSNLIKAASTNGVQNCEGAADNINSSEVFNFSPAQRNEATSSDDDELQREVMKVRRELDVEHSFHRTKPATGDSALHKQLLEEQRDLEEKEAKRDEERRRRHEEALAEERRLEEELKKIEVQKQEQQKRRDAEKRRLMQSNEPYGLRTKTGTFTQGTFSHWLIDEAERSRLADEQGRKRTNVLAADATNNHTAAARNNGGVSGGALPDHVIQRLTQRSQPTPMARTGGGGAGTQQLPSPLHNLWNDPSTQATLL